MTYTGVNFRQTQAYVTDGPNDVWCGNVAGSYKTVLDGGTGAGWNAAIGLLANQSTSVDVRLAGVTTFPGSPAYRVSVPNGTYDVRLAIVEPGTTGATQAGVRLVYGAGSTPGIDYTDIIPAAPPYTLNSCFDAQGTIMLKTAWPASNVPRRVVVTNGELQVKQTPGNNNAGVHHMSWQLVATNLVDGVATNDTGAAGTTPVIMEAQPEQKVLGFYSFAEGGPQNISYTVKLADGVTPDPYFSTRFINNKLAICYSGARCPGTGPTRTIYLVQTDKVSGAHLNSPYTQALTYNVTAAPTKPYGDGSLEARISTGCYLQRKYVIDRLTAPYMPDKSGGLWKGYQGEAFTQSITVYNTTGFFNAMNILKAQAGGNKWFCIEIDQDGTSNWDTTPIAANGNANGDWVFTPELGGGCLIRYKATGAKPLLYGSIYPHCPRGVQIDGLTICSDGSIPYAASCIIFDSGVAFTSGAIALLKISNCKIGFKFNPAYASWTPKSFVGGKANVGGIIIQGQCEQLICVNNQISGVQDAYGSKARYLYIENDDVSYIVDDVMGAVAIDAGSAANYPGNNVEQFWWFNGQTLRAVNNTPSAYHGDWYQQRYSGATTFSVVNLLCENMIIDKSYDDAGVEAQMTQLSDAVPLRSVFVNNIMCSYSPRGIDLSNGAGINSYAEYNTLGIPGAMKAAAPTYPGQGLYQGSAGSVLRGRKNITTGDFLNEDCLNYSTVIAGNKDPNALMQGPFIVDPTQTARWVPAAIIAADPIDAATAPPLQTFRKAMIATHTSKTGVDAGAYSLPVPLAAGESVVMTKIEAASLTIPTLRAPAAAQNKNVTVRWAGSLGSDVNVVIT